MVLREILECLWGEVDPDGSERLGRFKCTQSIPRKYLLITSPPGQQQAAGQPEERRPGREEAQVHVHLLECHPTLQVLQVGGLGGGGEQGAEAADRAQVRVRGGHEELRGVQRVRLDQRARGLRQGGDPLQGLLGIYKVDFRDKMQNARNVSKYGS